MMREDLHHIVLSRELRIKARGFDAVVDFQDVKDVGFLDAELLERCLGQDDACEVTDVREFDASFRVFS